MALTEKFKISPLKYSIYFIAAISIGRIFFVSFAIRNFQILSDVFLLIPFATYFFTFDFFTRYLFSIPAIILIGIAVQKNGFAYVFTFKNFSKGLFVFIPAFFILILYVSVIFFVEELHTDILQWIPRIIFEEIARGTYEEVLFRGLLMTPFIVNSEWAKNTKVRLTFIILCGVFFGLIHFPLNIYVAVFAISMGIIFCAAYAYSKSLICCIIVHAILNISSRIIDLLVLGVDGYGYNALFLNISGVVILMVSVISVLFAVVLTVRT